MKSSDDTNRLDQGVRLYVYEHFVGQQRPPTVAEAALALKLQPEEVQATYERLARNHVLVLEPDRCEIRMAMPFSAVPTAFKVTAEGQSWWANCAWDALGIPAALGKDARIETTCADCGDPVLLRVENEGLAEGSGVIHFAVPAANWWDDVIFT